MTPQSFYGYSYTCNKFGHRVVCYRSNTRRSGYALQHGVTWYNYNKSRHIARFCKGKTVISFAPQKKVDLVQPNKEIDKIWKKKKEDEVKDIYIPLVGAKELSTN